MCAWRKPACTCRGAGTPKCSRDIADCADCADCADSAALHAQQRSISPKLLASTFALALRRAVARLVAMVACHTSRSQGRMFRLAALHTLAPQAERTRLQLLAHQRDNGGLIKRELGLNGLERRAVLPGHFNDPGYRSGVE